MSRKPRRRDVAIVEMAARGVSPQVLAVLTGMSATRVRQIIRAARGGAPPIAEMPRPRPMRSITAKAAEFLLSHRLDRRRNGKPMAVGPEAENGDGGEDG